MFLTEAEN